MSDDLIENVPGTDVVRRVRTVEELEETLAKAGEIIQGQRAEADWLFEGMRDLQFALENRGWKLLHGGIDQRQFNGLDIDVLQGLSDELRAYLTGGSLGKRLIEVRSNFIVGGGGVEYKSLGNATRALADPINQEKVFSSAALAEIVRAQGTDGNVIVLVNTKTKKTRRLPFNQVKSLYLDPDDAENIWFIKEQYTRVTVDNPRGEEVEKWYRVDLFQDDPRAKVKKSINEGNNRRVKIDPDWIAVVGGVNKQIGHTLGTPDLLASLPWLERYNEYLNTQLDFQKALSAIAVHIKAKTTKAQDQARSAVRGGGKGTAAVTDADTSIEAQRGGSDVSFENGRPLASMASTGAEVSVVHALSDPGASGSSYGSAQTLDSPTQKMIVARRDALSLFLKRVFTLLGAPKVEIKWPRIEDEATYRLIQAVGLLWQSGLFAPEELRAKFGELVDLAVTGTAPAGVMIPNNINSIKAESKVQTEMAKAEAGFAVNAQGRDAQGQGKMNDQAGDRPIRDDER